MRCVLAYSGGLDTTTIVIWLQEQGYEVHAVLVDVGQGEDMEALCRKALRLGAKTAVIRDARPAMCNEVLPWVIRLGATYEGVYRLGTALARPFIAAEQVKLAKSLGGATLVHGATGKGNDQIRFEFAYRSLAPECPVLAPWKVWNLRGRSDMIDYLRQHGVEESFEVTKTYSLDENLWHLSIEGGTLEDPTAHVDVERILGVTADRFTGSTSQAYLPSAVELEFVDGVPVALNGSMGTLATIVNTLNVRFRQAPWAWDMVIENRFTGIKSRGLYINPAAKVLGWAVDALARTCLNKAAYDSYTSLGRDYGAILYRGEFFSDQRKMLESAALPIAGRLTGKVKVELTPAPYVSQIVAPASTFTQERATFEESEFAHQDAAGFIRLAWLSSAGRSFEEADHGGDVAAGSSTPSGVSALQPEPERGLVPAAS
jgi:argininosuccinate synthase